MLYEFLASPLSISDVVPSATPIFGSFNKILGHSAFGDLFVQNPDTNQIGVFVAAELKLVDVGHDAVDEFTSKFLEDPSVASEFLRQDDLSKLIDLHDDLGKEEVFYPVPHPVIGGSGNLDTYQKGNVFTNLEILAQTLS